MLLQQLRVFLGGVLHAAAGMVRQSLNGAPPPESHLQRILEACLQSPAQSRANHQSENASNTEALISKERATSAADELASKRPGACSAGTPATPQSFPISARAGSPSHDSPFTPHFKAHNDLRATSRTDSSTAPAAHTSGFLEVAVSKATQLGFSHKLAQFSAGSLPIQS